MHSLCGGKFHREATCWKKHGYPPGHPKHKSSKQRQGGSTSSSTPSANHVDCTPTFKELQSTMPNLTEDQYVQILAALNAKPAPPQANKASTSASDYASGLLPVAPNRWIIDSGATHHITSSSNLLSNTNKHPSLPPVALPSGDKAGITMTGSIRFNDSVRLDNILCVPSFNVDLLSVAKCTDALHCSVTFFPSWCILQDLDTRTMIGVGKRRGDLYYLVALASIPPSHHFACNLTISSNLWHRRLGHPSSARLQHLAKNNLHFVLI